MLPRVLASSSRLVAVRTSAPRAKGVRREGEDTAVHEDTSMHEDITVHEDIAVHQGGHRVPRGGQGTAAAAPGRLRGDVGAPARLPGMLHVLFQGDFGVDRSKEKSRSSDLDCRVGTQPVHKGTN